MRRGFTLVELLVVIGIIAVLIAILLPALNRAKAAAQAVACSAQLRDLGNAMVLYTHSNRGFLPAARSSSEGFIQGSWMFKLQPYLNRRPVGVGTFNNETIFGGIFRCTAKTDWDPQSLSDFNRISYAMNAFNRPPRSTAVEAYSIRIADLKPSTEVTLVTDTGEPDYRLRHADFLYVTYPVRTLRHNKRHNVLFCDGHVEAVPKNGLTFTLLGRNP
jgi:prepilin-type N-terminal cleavage/methylation domain-containing protein/prepilin-type processing-associated H-X9-DG protein